MNKLTVLVADPDQQYIDYVNRYIRSSDHASQLQLKYFTSVEPLQRYLELESDTHILLIHPYFLQSDLTMPKVRLLIQLMDSGVEAASDTETLSVYKYQPLDQFFTSITAMYMDRIGQVAIPTQYNGATKVVSVFSFAGGTGKTMLAVNLAKQLSLQGHRALYFSLETVSSLPVWQDAADGQGFAELLYYLRSKPLQAAAKLEQLKQTDPDTRMDYLEPLSHLKELLEMKESDIKVMFDQMRQAGKYDYIVADLDHSLHSRILSSLEHCDIILHPITDDLQVIHKTVSGMELLEASYSTIYAQIAEKTTFIMNKYTGQLHNTFDYKIEGYLPYIPEWKVLNHRAQLSTNSTYHDSIEQLISIL